MRIDLSHQRAPALARLLLLLAVHAEAGIDFASSLMPVIIGGTSHTLIRAS